MATSRQFLFDPATFQDEVTDLVRFWLIDDEEGLPPSTSLAGRCGRDGPCHAALDAEDLDQAAEALRAWIHDRLISTRATGNPLDTLGGDLLEATLAAVNWRELADEIRD